MAPSRGHHVDSKKAGFTTIDQYIALFPAKIQVILQELRATIKVAAPDAEEKISYQMPTFALKGNLIHFAAFKDHIGVFPGALGDVIQAFPDEVPQYVTGKGTLRFPSDQPLPLELISRIVKFRVAQNLEKAKAKSGSKKQAA